MAKPKSSRPSRLSIYRRALILPYVCAAAVLLPLALIRGCETTVRVEAIVRELSFDLRKPSPLVDGRPYDSLFVAQRAIAEWRRDDGRILRVRSTPSGSLSIEQPVLVRMNVQPPARVSFARTDITDVSMSVRGGAVDAQLSAEGRLLRCDHCEIDGVATPYFETPLDGSVVLRSDGADFHAVLSGTGSFLGDGLSIANPTFVTGPADRPVSSVIKGDVSFGDSRGPAIAIHRAQSLEIRDARELEIVEIETAPDAEALRVVITGRTTVLRVAGENRLPSLLERIHAQQAVVLYFSAILFVAGTIVNVARQLHLVREPK